MLNYVEKIYLFMGFNKKYEGTKTVLMGLCFFIVLGAYTIIKEIKDSIFCLIVGQSYLPDVKNISYLIMIPLVFFYSWLASKIKREYLLVFYSIIYGIGGLIIAYYLMHPTIGFYNPIKSYARIFGWISYLFLEGFSPFVVSVLWAFFNSMAQPEELKNKYIIMTVCAKMGAMLTSCFAWMIMSKYIVFAYLIDEVHVYAVIMQFASSILLLIPCIIFYLLYAIPNDYLKGYSDRNIYTKDEQNEINEKDGSGFTLLFKYRYVFGIFGMIFFWEAINVVFNYMRLSIGLREAETISDFGAFLYKNAMMTNLVGFLIASIGTSSIINLLGHKISLILIPVLTGGAIISCLYWQTTSMVIFTYIFIRAVNNSFAYPLRESLYIPTTDSIKFKSKAWIDSFGSKLSKAFGSLYNKGIQFVPSTILGIVQFGFFFGIITLWILLANYMGTYWKKSIETKKVIGE